MMYRSLAEAGWPGLFPCRHIGLIPSQYLQLLLMSGCENAIIWKRGLGKDDDA